MQLVAPAEFARRAGLNRSSVKKAIDKNRLPIDPASGKIDLDNEDVKSYATTAKFNSFHHIPFNEWETRHPSQERTPAAPPATVAPVASPAVEPPETAPPVGAPAERTPYPALQAAEIDPRSPAVLDALDGLDDPYRVGLVDRGAVVNLVQALYSVLMVAPVGEDSLALDPYDLAGRVSGIFKDFLRFTLESDIEAILNEAESATREKENQNRARFEDLPEEI